MKLSMWILADWLKDFSPEIHIREGGLQIETVRLFSSGFTPSENCVYVGRMEDLFLHGRNQVICTHKNDILILKTDDIDEILNQVLNAFEYYRNWDNHIQQAINEGRRPADLLDIAGEVLSEPMYLLDSNQFAIALSKQYGLHEVNELWDQMLQEGTANMDFLTRLEAEYPSHRTTRGLYHFSVSFIRQAAYNYNMFSGQQWVGLCSMIERNPPLPQYKIDLFHIFCQEIEQWFLTISREKENMLIDSMFREALQDPEAAGPAFIRQYQLRFQKTDMQKYLIVLRESSDQPYLISHVCRELNLIFPELMAIIYQNDICVIVNCGGKGWELFERGLLDVLRRNRYYGGYSREFTDLKEVMAHYHEALYAAEHTKAQPGNLSGFAEHVLQYALDGLAEHMNVNAMHPEAQKLISYDRTHGTEFAYTLFVYLEQERSQSKTAQKLNLHRNSLTYRLQRIRELTDADLDDPDTRLHMLLSFRIFKADAPC